MQKRNLLLFILFCVIVIPSVRVNASSYTCTYHFITQAQDVSVEDLYCNSEVSTTFALPAPTREGYVFGGWYNDAACENEYDLRLPENGDTKILYAKWIAEDPIGLFTITYHLSGGSFLEDYPTVFYDKQTVTIPAPVNERYLFDGWYLDSSFSNPVNSLSFTVATDIHLYAKWKTVSNQYPITYYTNGGDLASGSPEYVTGSLTVIPSPTKEGCRFEGWYLDANFTTLVPTTGISVSNAISVYAKWVALDLNIYYEVNGGKLAANTPTKLSTTGTLQIPYPTKDGYIFEGWYLDAALTKSLSNTSITEGPVTLYAKWKGYPYLVAYHCNGGSLSSYVSYFTADEGLSSLSMPYRKGYTFLGWYLNDNLTGSITNVPVNTKSDLDVYAKWKANTYSIQYELNGGKNASNPTTYTYGVGVGSLVKPSRTGYQFDGWYLEKTYKTIVNSVGKYTEGNITLYAKWKDAYGAAIEEGTTRVYYVLNGGKNSSKNPKYLTDGQTLNLSNPSLSEYLFDGWYSDAKYKNKVTSVKAAGEGSITVYAKWKYLALNLSWIKAKNIKKKTLKIWYSKNKMASGYQIKVSTSKKFTKKTTKTVNITKTSYKAKKLKKGKRYYMKVRAYGKDSTGKKIYGPWTIPGKFKIYQ